jgi:hypothetical protein
VRAGHHVGDLDRDVEQPANGDRAAFDNGGQAVAVDELCRDVQVLAVAADVIDPEDVGVVERGGRARS